MLFCAFQSTPPRGRRHHGLSHFVPSLTISIHASAREVTGFLSRFSWNLVISIHASAREATPVCRSPAALCRIFQSTPPRGRRPYKVSSSTQSTIISIHASAREATNTDYEQYVIIDISIHASAREATCCEEYKENTNPFQSTPPRGRRL